MSAGGRDDFYVGYLDRAPAGLSRFVKRVVLLLAVVALLVVLVAAAMQREMPDGTFEFGVQRTFEGVLFEMPIPILRVTPPPDARRPGAAALLLVGLGKHGIPEEARGHHGSRVRFEGSLIYRREMAMVEMNDPGSFEVLGPAQREAGRQFETLGRADLTGELVDSKCYLGVMRPATGKVHRACAIRCLKGGVPPALLVRDRDGASAVFMLIEPDGGPPNFDVQLAGRQVRARGVLERHDGLNVLRIESLTPIPGG